MNLAYLASFVPKRMHNVDMIMGVLKAFREVFKRN